MGSKSNDLAQSGGVSSKVGEYPTLELLIKASLIRDEGTEFLTLAQFATAVELQKLQGVNNNIFTSSISVRGDCFLFQMALRDYSESIHIVKVAKDGSIDVLDHNEKTIKYSADPDDAKFAMGTVIQTLENVERLSKAKLPLENPSLQHF